MKLLGYLLLIVGLSASSWAVAQSAKAYRTTRLEKKADYLFRLTSYQDAVVHYRRALQRQEDNPQLKLKIAESYFALNQPQAANQWYAQVAENEQVFRPEHRWHYAKTLLKNSQRDAARQQLQQYLTEAPNHQTARNMMIGIEQYDSFYQMADQYVVRPININDTTINFSPVFYQESLVFASSQLTKNPQKKYHRDGSSFLRLYQATPTGEWSEAFGTPQPLLNQQLVDLHEGPVAFFNNDNEAIITTNNPNFRKDHDRTVTFNRLQLQSIQRAATGEWSKPTPLSFNSDDYSVGHPAVTADGKTLYFASDQPGGYGGVDLYVAYREGGQWSKPVNLGNQVNTDGNEVFPALHQNQMLYFASDGHPGLGGLDLFSVSVDSLTSTLPQNIGSPINSTEDDFGMVMRTNAEEGYFSSRRHGKDNIYYFHRQLPSVEKRLDMVVRLIDGITGQPIPNANMTVERTDHKTSRQNYATDEQGELRIIATKASVYEIAGELEGNSWKHPPVSTHEFSAEEENVIEITLFHRVDAITAMDIIVFDRFAERSDVLVSLNNRLYIWEEQAGGSFLVRGQKQIMLYRSSRSRGKVGLDEINQVLTQEGVGVRSITLINNIYFNFDRHNIRTDARAALDKLAEVMRAYPELRINAGAHTDSRGSNQYNQQLSQRRARSAVAYLTTQGIDSNRLSSDSFGEKQLFNTCTDDAYCSAQQHQANRRVEFSVTGISSTAVPIAIH